MDPLSSRRWKKGKSNGLTLVAKIESMKEEDYSLVENNPPLVSIQPMPIQPIAIQPKHHTIGMISLLNMFNSDCMGMEPKKCSVSLDNLLLRASNIALHEPRCVFGIYCTGKQKTPDGNLIIKGLTGDKKNEGYILLPYMNKQEYDDWKLRKIPPKRKLPCILCLRKLQVERMLSENILLPSAMVINSSVDNRYVYCNVDTEDGYQSNHVFWLNSTHAIVKPSLLKLVWKKDPQDDAWVIDQSSITCWSSAPIKVDDSSGLSSPSSSGVVSSPEVEEEEGKVELAIDAKMFDDDDDDEDEVSGKEKDHGIKAEPLDKEDEVRLPEIEEGIDDGETM